MHEIQSAKKRNQSYSGSWRTRSRRDNDDRREQSTQRVIETQRIQPGRRLKGAVATLILLPGLKRFLIKIVGGVRST